jgi:hypothetical protein
MCIITVPVTRGAMLIGGIWQRPQFALKTCSPGLDRVLFIEEELPLTEWGGGSCIFDELAPIAAPQTRIRAQVHVR